MAKNEVSLLIKIRQTGESVFGKISASLGGLASAAKGVLAGAAAVGGFVYAVQRLAEAGEQALAVVSRFRGSMRGLGMDAEGVVKTLTQVTRGLLDDSDLMKLANKGIVDGGLSVEQLAQALEFATLKAQELQVPVAEFSQQMVQSLASGNLRGLAEAFPAIRLQLEALDANGALDNQRKRAEGLRIAFANIHHDLPGLREDIGGLDVSAQQFKVSLHNALEQAEIAIASSPAVKTFFEDVQVAITKLIERLPELLPKIEAVVGGLAKIAERALNLFGQLAEHFSGDTQTQNATIFGKALTQSMAQLEKETDPDGPGARRIKDNIEDLLGDIAIAVRGGGKLTGLSHGELSEVAKALDQIADGSVRVTGVAGDRLLILKNLANELRGALISASNAAGTASGTTGTAPTGTGTRTRFSFGGGDEFTGDATKIAAALERQRTLFYAGARSAEEYKAAIATFVEQLVALSSQASKTTVDTGDASQALSRLAASGAVSDEVVGKLAGSVKNLRDDLTGMNPDPGEILPPWNALEEQIKQIGEAAERAAAQMVDQFGNQVPLEIRNLIDDMDLFLDRIIAMGEKFSSTLESAFSTVATGVANMFAELVGGGTAEYKQQSNELKAKEREVRLEFEQGKLSAEQYQEQLSRIAQERAALKEANNPFKRFAASVLGTLGDLAISLGVFAIAYGKFRVGLLANPFGVAAAAFAAGIILKAAAAKVGGSIGGMRGDIGAVGGGVSGFNDSSASSEQRPVVFINIVGQTTGEVVKSLVYDVARFGNTGGRIPGQAKAEASVTVPGLVVQGA